MENEKKGFNYTYSAREKEELRRIQRKYQPIEENKMEQIRKLDQSATDKATMVSVAVGMAGALFFGLGLTCCLMCHGVWFIIGLVIGLLGLVPAGITYPLYTRIVKRERERIGPEIMRLSEELMD